MINWLIEKSVKNPVLTIFLTILICIIGAFLFRLLPVDVYPDLNAPLVNIITECPGMAPQDVERSVTYPIESMMNGAPHVINVRSETSIGISIVTVEFDWGTNVYRARQIVSSRLELISDQLPEGASHPMLGPISSRMGEVMQFIVYGEGVSQLELRDVADWVIRYRLLGVPGVAYLTNQGGYIKQFNVYLDPYALRSYHLTIRDIKEALERSNFNPSGGLLISKEREYIIRGLGRIHNIEDIENTVITSRNGVPVRIKDVAEVKIGHPVRRGDSSQDGEDCVTATLEKQYGGNTLATIARVKKVLAELAKGLPERIHIKTVYDQSILIWEAIHNVERSILEGAILVVIVILFFMGNTRSALIASLTIPFSIFVAIILMYLGGISINVMSLGGLALGIGKLANSSIIMVENIYRMLLKEKEKRSRLDITLEAAKEVGPHIFSASLIIVLAFVPLFFMGGLSGRMFAPTAFTVAAVMIGGLFCSLTLKPVLCALALTEKSIPDKENRLFQLSQRAFLPIFRYCRHHRAKTIGITVAGLIITIILTPYLGREFLPRLDESALLISTQLRPGTSLAETARIGKKVERTLLTIPEVVTVNRTSGMPEESEHFHPVSHSEFLVNLLPKEKRHRSLDAIIEEVRHKLDQFPGMYYLIEQPIQNKFNEMVKGTIGDVAVKLFGPDLKVLNEKIEEIKNVMAGVPGVADLEVEQTAGIPQISIRLDRGKLARYGLNIGDVADVMETALNGIKATDIFQGNRKYTLFLRLPERYRSNLETIENLLLDTPNGGQVPLKEVATISLTEGPSTIMRENVTRRRVVLCNVRGRDTGKFVEDVKKALAEKVKLPPGYYIQFGGQYEDQQQAVHQLAIMGVVVALVVFIILFSTFGSVSQAFLIILNIPFALMGGIIALFIGHQTLNVSSLIGLIALFGISVQNGLILIAYINELRRNGTPLHQAVVEGSLVRLRPILMTALVMSIGVLPLVIARGTGSEIHRPLAIVYIGGLIISTFVTMVFLPILYEMLEGWKERRRA